MASTCKKVIEDEKKKKKENITEYFLTANARMHGLHSPAQFDETSITHTARATDILSA